MFSLILTFCTMTTCEEYVIDHNLTATDCIERKREELNDMAGEKFNYLYKDAVQRYQAVSMTGEIEKVTLKCEAE